jgi:hypothetical protein
MSFVSSSIRALRYLEFRANQNGIGDILQLGDGSSAQTSLAMVPHDITAIPTTSFCRITWLVDRITISSGHARIRHVPGSVRRCGRR